MAMHNIVIVINNCDGFFLTRAMSKSVIVFWFFVLELHKLTSALATSKSMEQIILMTFINGINPVFVVQTGWVLRYYLLPKTLARYNNSVFSSLAATWWQRGTHKKKRITIENRTNFQWDCFGHVPFIWWIAALPFVFGLRILDVCFVQCSICVVTTQ